MNWDASGRERGASSAPRTRRILQAEKYQRRWIWELFQNALDAAPASAGITLRLRLDGNFMLSHNGLPFSTKEILHLIFHGSTKREKEDSIGRYGTGFLTTHVISRKVRVSAALESDQAFDFVLDRGGATPSDLASAMEQLPANIQCSQNMRAQLIDLPSGLTNLRRSGEMTQSATLN